jgi:hypothetical protein
VTEEPSSEPTAKNYSSREELAQNRGILRWPCGRFEQSDTGESCGVEGVSQLPLKDKAFSSFLGESPPFELRRNKGFRLQNLFGNGSSSTTMQSSAVSRGSVARRKEARCGQVAGACNPTLAIG